MTKYLFYFLKYLFVILFVTTGIGKLLDNRGFSEVIGTYQILPSYLTLFLGLIVSLFELFLGLAILLNYRLKACALLAIILHLGYVALATVSLLRGLSLANCGCFGVFWARPLTYQSVIEDMVLVLLSILFYKTVSSQGAKNEK